jgi:membrane-associated phospholipid phosphatase
MLGVFLCGCAAEFTNIFKKISLHMIAMGGLVAFMAWQQATDAHWPVWWVPMTLLLAGLVGTARLLKNAHAPSEVYAGFLAGIICQLAAGVMVG